MNKKISIIIDNLSPHWWIQKVAFNQALWLSKKWYNIELLIMNKINIEIINDDKINIIYLNRPNIWKTNKIFKIFEYFKRWIIIAQHNKKNNIQISIWHWWDSWIPTIISKTLYSKTEVLYWQHSSTQSMNSFWQILYKFFFRFSNYIITVSEEDKIYLSKKFNKIRNKIIYINNFYIPEKTKGKFNFHFNKDILYFIHIWALEEYKNQEIIIKAFKKLNKNMKNINLLIIWTWSKERKLKNIAKWNKNIIFLWYQERTHSFIEKANCFLISSLYEWLPLSLIDSLYYKKPIISTQIKTWINELIIWEYKNIKIWQKWFKVFSNWIITDKNINDYYKWMLYFIQNNNFNIKDISEKYSLETHLQKLIKLF